MSSPAAAGAQLSIGEVLNRLRPDFPDVTISKIRFLEAEGLVEPERSPSGYRRFSPVHVERLRFVLAAQRDQYLPLRVIREHLDALDRGVEPPAVPGGGNRVPPALLDPQLATPGPDSFAAAPKALRLSRDELLEAAGIDTEALAELETYGLTGPVDSFYSGDDLDIARAVAELRAYGLEARHLRSFKTAADREIGLIQQVIMPLRGSRTGNGRDRADEVVRELAALSVRLHAALVRAGLGRG